ncbi:MAG: hypothetical protein JWM95_765 [Gemmatimonadetes bacterium]|nr:hypothetical protein [Gemmatimonadota bacterium]
MVLVTEIALALAMMQAPNADRPASTAVRSSVRIRPFSSVARPADLLLRGARVNRDIVLSIPRSARGKPGLLDVGLLFNGEMHSGANVQFFVNRTRRALVERHNASPDGRARIAIPLRIADLSTGTVTLGIESRLPALGDQCDDAKRSSVLVKIDPASTLMLGLDSRAAGATRYDIDGLAEQLTVSVADRAMTATELDTTLVASALLTQQGHTVHFIRGGGSHTLIASVQADVLPGDVLRAADIDVHPRAINPSLPELGVVDLGRRFTRTTTWHIPLDMRVLPAGRVPDRIVLKMVAAPDQLDDLLDVRIYLNDFLLRPADVRSDGTRRTIRVTLPMDELNIYNDVRIVAERAHLAIGLCTAEPVAFPAQIQDDSYLVTAGAPSRPRQFATFIGKLPGEFDLFLPASTAMHGETILPLLLSAERSLWGPRRHARIRYYAAGESVSPDRPSVVVRAAAGSETVVQLVRMRGQPVVTITPALHEAVLTDVPDAYVNTDSIAFDVTGLGRGARIVALRDNTGTVDAIRFALEYRIWVVLATLLTLSGIFALYARVRRPSIPVRR